MKSTDLFDALDTALKAGLSAFIKGPAGGGKTTMVRAYGKRKKMNVVHCHAPLMDLLDVKGCISTAEDYAKFLPLEMWPKEGDGPSLIIIDEFPQCVTAIQNAFSQLLIESIMGDVRLPKGSMVIATGNRKQDKAAANNIPAHIINRTLHINLDEDRDGWFDWASKTGVHPHVLAFIKFKPDALFTFD
ncbi:MAG TPA: AAA family ATPase, partial [Dehalococcoidia bacterium]|nr:AAA family ATPase [Dehalococcoidia bacterium]